jgi:quinol monooxygenase YgiN
MNGFSPFHLPPATRSVSDPNRFRVVEVYASQEALDNHIKGEHLPKMMKFIKDHDPLAAPFVFEKHTYVEA